MKHILISALMVVLTVGCGGSDPKKPTMTVDANTAIKVQKYIPYVKGARIALNIKNECQLQDKLSSFVEAYSVGEGIGVVRKGKVTKNTKGKALVISITDAVSSGNAFIGHRKFASIKGTLYNNGKRQAGFTASRVSGGGAFGGFKGSCDVLGRTVKILGQDVSTWLQHPVDGAHLGDRI
jgi:hypothetical protein